MPVLEAQGLTKTVGVGRAARRVLDGVSLDVDAGEVVAVLGRSGSGKSTLLHLLGGLDRPDAGTIEVAGVRVDRADEAALTRLRRRHVGFVFQSFHLLPELTGLEDAASRLPTTLSGGEQQRLAIVRALVNDPALVLADEPTGNLDVESGSTVLHLLRAIADQGRGVVLVTHDPEASAIADRLLVLRDGRLDA